jgi:hypothetical protein
MRSFDYIVAVAYRELRTNASITVYTFDGLVEHRRGVELPQQAMGWQWARRSAQRKGLRRALGALAFLPVALFIVGGCISLWIPPFDKSVTEAQDRWEGSGLALLILFMMIPLMIIDLRAFRGDPIVMRGEVVKKSEWSDDAAPAPFFKWILGYDLEVNVKKAVRIGRDGYHEDQDRIGDEKEVPSTRRVNRKIKELNQEIFLVCNPSGRAVAFVSDLHDDVVAEELRAVLDTATAAAPVPEQAIAPQPEAVK